MTAIMESLSQKQSDQKESERLFDPYRRQWVKRTPEEAIRQALLKKMTIELDYPIELIAIEKDLRQLPHLFFQKVPNRRADIICFGKDVQGSLFPLLMVECKAVPINAKVLRQVIGYNTFVQALFLAVANGQEIHTGFFDPDLKQYSFQKCLPSYPDLLGSKVNLG